MGGRSKTRDLVTLFREIIIPFKKGGFAQGLITVCGST